MTAHAHSTMFSNKPWMFVDRIVALQPNERIVTLKNISGSDCFVRGHFPNYSVYPGLLLTEGMKQSAQLLLAHSGWMAEEASFRQLSARYLCPVRPGDQVIYELSMQDVTDLDGEVTTQWAGGGRIDEQRAFHMKFILITKEHRKEAQ